MTPPPGTPSDWVSGERVFAPPHGTVDVDWLVPAVVELVPGSAAAQARAALERAWRRRRADAGAPGAVGVPGTPAAPDPVGTGTGTGTGTGLDAAAARVLAEALETFGG